MKNFLLACSFVLLGVGCSAPSMIGVIPLPGTWSFHLDVSTSYLQGANCPTSGSPVGRLSAGEAEVAVTETGSSVAFDLDGQSLLFHQQGTGVDYRTNSRMFPVRTTTGTNYGNVFFDFVANTNDTIIGTLHWDNRQGCEGNYPFTMELIEAELPDSFTSYTPFEGSWNVTEQDITDDCEGDISGFSNIPDTLNLTYNLDLDTGLPDSSDFTFSPMSVPFERLGESNFFAQAVTSFDAGLPIDSNGDVLLDYEDQSFSAVAEFELTAENEMTGTVYISSGSCQAMMTMQLEAVPPLS